MKLMVDPINRGYIGISVQKKWKKQLLRNIFPDDKWRSDIISSSSGDSTGESFLILDTH